MRKSAKQRGGDLVGGGSLRSKARQSVIENAIQLPFQGVAHVGQGRNRISFKAGLLGGKRVGVKIRF